MKTSYFRFLELTMAVILGSLLVSFPESLVSSRNFWGNLQISLLLVNICAFLEMYIILSRYHRTLEIDYPAVMLFIELIIGVLFLIALELTKASQNDIALIDAIWVMIGIYLIVVVRQLMNIWPAMQLDQAKFKGLDFQKESLFAPIVVNCIAVGLLLCVRKSILAAPHPFVLTTQAWASVLPLAYGVYFLLFYMFKMYQRNGDSSNGQGDELEHFGD